MNASKLFLIPLLLVLCVNKLFPIQLVQVDSVAPVLSIKDGVSNWSKKQFFDENFKDTAAPDCPVQLISGHESLTFQCILEQTHSIQLDNIDQENKSQLYGLKLKIYIPEESLNQEYYLEYHSTSNAKSRSLALLSTHGLKADTWIDYFLWLPGLNRKKPVFYWQNLAQHNEAQLSYRFKGMNLGVSKLPLENEIFKRNLGKKIESLANSKILIHSVELLQAYFEETTLPESEEHLTDTIARTPGLVPLILLGLLLLLRWRNFKMQVLFVSLLPLCLGYLFFQSAIQESFQQIETNNLNVFRKELLDDWKRGAQSLLRVKEALRYEALQTVKLLEKSLVQTPTLEDGYFEGLEEDLQMIDQVKTIKGSQQLLLKRRQELKKRLLHTIQQRYKDSREASFLTRQGQLILNRDIVDSETHTSFVNFFVRYLSHTYWPFHLNVILMTENGFRIIPSNGQICFSSNRISKGWYPAKNALYMINQILADYDKEGKIDNLPGRARLLEEALGNQKIDIQFLYEFAQLREEWSTFTDNSDNTYKWKLWTKVASQNDHPWYVHVMTRQSRILHELVKELKAVYRNSQTDFSLPGLDHLLYSPVSSEHQFMEQAASYLGKTQKSNSVVLFQKTDGSYHFLYINPLPELSHLSLTTHRKYSSYLAELNHAKNRLFIVFLSTIVILLFIIIFFSNKLGRALDNLLQTSRKIRKKEYSISSNLSAFEGQDVRSINSYFLSLADQLKTKEALMSLISASSIDDILSNEARPKKENGAVLFFALHPEEPIDSWKVVLPAVHEAIQKHEGRIDKFTGEAILGFFLGAKASENALRAALAMKSCEHSGVRLAIGVSYGEIIVGAVGSTKRRDFTCIGSAVNLSARLESWGISQGKSITVSEDLFQLIPEELQSGFENVSEVVLKGLTKTQEIHTL